ncbi:radical SAM protein [Candidatus Berkelbacteria bacterium]|nr:radical SAM protein [Candidatus Berkelbacteria bacterium]
METTEEMLPVWNQPVAAYINLTERCNLQCKTCYFAAKIHSDLIEMSTETIIAAMSKLAEVGVKYVVLAGGEPLLRSDLATILQEAKNRFEDVTLITNGTLVRPEIARIITERTHQVQVSLDGPDEESNSLIRGEGAFERAISGVKLLKEAGAKILIVCTITKVNIGLVPRMAALARELDVELGSSIFLATGHGACNEKCLSPAWQDLLADFRNEIFQLAEESDLSGSQYTSTSDLRIGMSCGSGTQLISIAPDGNIYPCHVLHRPEYVIGNITTNNDLLSILESSPVVQRFRQINVEQRVGCKRCDVRYFCRGGCIAQGIINTGRLGGKDRFCPLFTRVFRAQIWSIDDQMTDNEKAKTLVEALS